MLKKIFWISAAAIIFLFVCAFGISTYQYYKALHVDDPIDPYILVNAGKASVVRGEITINLEAAEKYALLENDTIITREKSEGTIFWPDRSTMHLGENSALTIEKMEVSKDYSSIRLEASLVQGKVYSNIVRTLFPGSKVTVRLPNQGVIAGVRGTEFVINLDANYIHSIDHVVTLQNSIFQNVTLLPGEAVKAGDIFTKVGVDLIDHIWEDAVALQSTAYQALHAESVKNAWEKISGSLTEKNYWDEFMRWALGKFSAFQEIEIVKYIRSDAEKLAQIPAEKLAQLYQKFKMSDFPNERDILRGAMFQISSADKKVQSWLETLTNEAIWDKIEFPTFDFANSDKILENMANSLNLDFDVFIHHISTKNYGDEIMNNFQNFFSRLGQ